MSAMLMAACLATSWGQDVETWVNGMMADYPQARLLDIYKSCFQDYMGAEHLVGDQESARAYLEKELASMEIDDASTRFYEPCGFNGNYVRVYLRAVKEELITAEALLDAFVRSANSPDRPDVATWSSKWQDIIAIIDGMGLELPHQQEDREYIEQVLLQGRYAISHSADYRETYSPHYRIIKREIFEQEIKSHLPCPCCH